MLDGLFMLLALSVVMALSWVPQRRLFKAITKPLLQMFPRRRSAPVNDSLLFPITIDLDDWHGSLGWDFLDSNHPGRN